MGASFFFLLAVMVLFAVGLVAAAAAERRRAKSMTMDRRRFSPQRWHRQSRRDS